MTLQKIQFVNSVKFVVNWGRSYARVTHIILLYKLQILFIKVKLAKLLLLLIFIFFCKIELILCKFLKSSTSILRFFSKIHLPNCKFIKKITNNLHKKYSSFGPNLTVNKMKIIIGTLCKV